MRSYEFKFIVQCVGQGDANLAKVEDMLDLSMQDLVMDDEFIDALDEKEAVTIQVVPLFGKTDG